MILVLAPESDGHARAVAKHIRDAGGEVAIVDLSAFPQRSTLELSFTCCGEHRFTLGTPSGRLALHDVRAAWWRRPQPPDISAEITNHRHRLFAGNECQEALAGLWHALDAFWINDPARDRVAHGKVTQLRVAEEVGLRIPETLITNDPGAARTFADRRGYRDVVYKAFSALEDEWRETRVLRPEELSMLDDVRLAPVIFQQYVDAVYDLRLTVVGEKLFPAAIYAGETAYGVDFRMDIGNARVEPVEIPDPVAEKILRFMERLGLVYGAIDMRLSSATGELVFLEINPAGQWLFIEERTGQPIARALADLLLSHD